MNNPDELKTGGQSRIPGQLSHGETQYSVEIDQVAPTEWGEIVSGFDDASLYQTWEYGSIHWAPEQLSYLILKEGSGIVAAAQVRVVTVPFLKRGIAYLPWGPLWRKRDLRRLGHLAQVLQALHDEYVVRRKLLLRIQPGDVEQEPDSMAVRLAFEAQGYRQDQNYDARRTFLLDLKPRLSELKRAFTRRWRRGLEKSLRNNLQVETGTSSKLLQDLCRMYTAMLERKKFIPGIDVAEIDRIQERLSESRKLQVFIVCSEGAPAAGIAVSFLGNRAVPILAATGETGLKSRASYLVQWKLIEWLKSRGAVSYDLGGIDPADNPGVYEFKKGLSGIEVSHLGRYEASTSRISNYISAPCIESSLRRVATHLA